jgi:hypothetical protein
VACLLSWWPIDCFADRRDTSAEASPTGHEQRLQRFRTSFVAVHESERGLAPLRLALVIGLACFVVKGQIGPPALALAK